ncbi:MAG TPA: hypothetical protein VK577_07325, partial [Bradyrhizobium sp.]|nr:hypothetical protein [Bradyrhizobium sp.]
NPAPTTATSTCCVVPPLVASERDAATIASGMPSSRAFYFAVGYSRAPGLSSGQFQSGFGRKQRKIVERTDDRSDAVRGHRVAAVDTKSRLAARKFSEAALDAMSTRPKVAGPHRVIIGKTNPKGLR